MEIKARRPPIYVYVPADSWPGDLSPGMRFFWSAHRGGKWNWTLQTYEHLKDGGIDCSMVSELPTEGVIIAHRKLFPLMLRPSAGQVIVCIEADRGRMPFAQLHVQQNPLGTALANDGWLGRLDQRLLGQPTNSFIYHWPQPNLIPRDQRRGNTFRNVVFHGRERNLVPEMRGQDFRGQVAALGLEFIPRFEKEQWNDYSDADIVVAIRDTRGYRHANKPATKLYNAWHAGLPAILGPESAFLAESDRDARGVPVDFILARTVQDVVSALRRLSTSADLRAELVARGRSKAIRTSRENIVKVWVRFLEECALPIFDRWTRMPERERRRFFELRALHLGLDRARQRYGGRIRMWARLPEREHVGGFEFHDDP